MSDTRGLARQLTTGQRIVLAVAVLLAVGLAAYGAVGSYAMLARLAVQSGVPLPSLVPLGIDGGLVGVVVLDLILAWTGSPLAWLRLVVRLLTVGTVVANVSAGWPDPIAVGLHAAAPLMLLVMVEAGRTVLLRRIGLATGLTRDRIPFGRWVLSPVHTWLLWRRMVLWQITDYRDALDMEVKLQRAITQLRRHYGRGWRKSAPPDLVWPLRAGLCSYGLFARIDTQLNEPHDASESAKVAEQASAAQRSVVDECQPNAAPAEVVDGDRQLREVVRINERHWARCGRPVSAETVRKHLRVGAARARELTRTVRAIDTAVVTRAHITAVE